MGMKMMWSLVLAVAWAGAGATGEMSQNMNNLSWTLQQEMADVMEMATVNYSTPVINVTYHARLDFDMRAMGPLYNSTHMVIDFIVNKDAFPEGLVSVSDGHVEVAPLSENVRPLLAHYAGPAAVLAVALLLVAVLPLAGLFWCCCYWCRAGRRRRPFDRKYDACLRGLLAITLIAVLTLFQFGVVCLFATEAQVEAGAAGAGGAARAAAGDARAFLAATAAHARHLLVDNYGELAGTLDALLRTSGRTVAGKLHEFNRAASLTTLSRLVHRLDEVLADLEAVRDLTGQLRAHADALNAGLRKVKAQLLQTLADCSRRKCQELKDKYNIGMLSTEIHYNKMPDVSGLMVNVSALLRGDMKAEVGAGARVFADIQAAIRDSVNAHIPAVQQAVAHTGQELRRVAEHVTAAAERAARALQDQEPLLQRYEDLHASYGPYRRYLGLGAAIAPLMITCVVCWGLACGVYGKRPDAYGAADCCNKGHGARALLCGVCLVWAVGGALALVVAAYFLAGAAAQRALCDPLTEPRGNRLFALVEEAVQLEEALYPAAEFPARDPAFNLTAVLVRCHDNRTVYETLQLWRAYDVESVRAAAARSLALRVGALRGAPPPRATLLRPAARAHLAALADSGLGDFDFERILHALDTNLTSLALESLARQLDATAAALGGAREAGPLRAAAASLRALHAAEVAPMRAATGALEGTATRLRDGLRFNHRSLREAIAFLVRETDDAEAFLNTAGPARLDNITRQYGAVLTRALDDYLARLQRAARHDVGRCGPLSAAYNATRDALCTRILMPVNGYWMSVSWCVVLFLPLAALCQRLARLYRQPDPYPGPLVEAEYLYDAYADRDIVPLANAYKGEKRAGRSGGGGSGGGGSGGAGRARDDVGAGGVPAAVAPPPDAHHARRYNDMAPKHWEEGPPRYHGPTEYERPPPYYYPGPADRQ